MSWLLRPIRVVGVGSPHGDDAVGWEVVRRLRERMPPVDGVEFHIVDGGQRLLDVLDGTGSLILIDAAVSGAAVGTIHRFEGSDDRLEMLRTGTTHDLGPAAALRLAAPLGIAPSRVLGFGIEAGEMDAGVGLSYAAAAAAETLTALVINEIGEGS